MRYAYTMWEPCLGVSVHFVASNSRLQPPSRLLACAFWIICVTCLCVVLYIFGSPAELPGLVGDELIQHHIYCGTRHALGYCNLLWRAVCIMPAATSVALRCHMQNIVLTTVWYHSGTFQWFLTNASRHGLDMCLMAMRGGVIPLERVRIAFMLCN